MIENGILAVKDKKIAFVGKSSDLPGEMTNWTKVDAKKEKEPNSDSGINWWRLTQFIFAKQISSFFFRCIEKGR